MIPLAPHVRLLLAMQAAGVAVDYLTDAGITGATIRHARNRKPVRGERPCITLIFVSDDPRGDDVDHNAWEQVRELVVDAQADLELSTEDSLLDPTGLSTLSRFLGAFMRGLKDPAQPSYLGGLCDDITAGSVDPEDRSTPDDGRMTRALTVLYRVRSDDPNVLLAAGENG